MNINLFPRQSIHAIGIIMFLIGLSFASLAYAYNFAGYRWSGSSPNVIVDQSQIYIPAWNSAITDAITAWNNTGAKFTFSNGTSSNKIGMSYESSTALAWTSLTRKYVWWGDVAKSTITINTYHRFNPPYASESWYDLRSVLRHEFGHWLVLDHTSNSSALMYPTIGYWDFKNITSDEINGIRAIYGTR